MTLVFATIGLANPRRFAWALRPVAAVIFIGYSAYVAIEFVGWLRGEPLGFGQPRSDSNLFNAICGFFVFAVPALMYLFYGRTGRVVDTLLQEKSKLDS
ncbi:hypothetical protein JXQ70_16915 [bacterium]|nr:hypothetical protein [bacterium]